MQINTAGTNGGQPSVQFECRKSADGSCVWETTVGAGFDANGAFYRGEIVDKYNSGNLNTTKAKGVDDLGIASLDKYTQPTKYLFITR